MKQLNEYVLENIYFSQKRENGTINEGWLSDIFNKIWLWIKGEESSSKFIYGNPEYNEKEKNKYISNYTSDVIDGYPVDSKNIMKVISKTLGKNGEKAGFWKSAEIAKNEDNKDLSWYVWIFKTPKLNETCAMMGYSVNKDSGSFVLKIFENTKEYDKVIDFVDIRNEMKGIAKKEGCTEIIYEDADNTIVKKLNGGNDEYRYFEKPKNKVSTWVF